MELYLLRHGIAVELGTEGCNKDADRPLTGKGERKVADVARAMQAMEMSFDLILSSPFLRARQTAEIVAGRLGLRKVLQLNDLLVPGGSFREVIEFLKKRRREIRTVLLVGHEPFMSGFIAFVLSGHPNVPLTMKKAGLCKLTFDALEYGRCARLEWLLTPAQMALMR